MNYDLTCEKHNQYDCEICEEKQMTMQATPQPTVTKRGALDMQVCVPAEWSDDQVKEFADRENLCGTTHGWAITREGDRHLAGDAERVPCRMQPGYVHIMLHA